MNKNICAVFGLIVLFTIYPATVSAYTINMDVSQYGYTKYSFPAILGDEDKPEEKKEEIKETPRVEKPERIEIKKEGSKIKIELKKQDKIEQRLNPEKTSLKFPAIPKTTPANRPEVKDVGDSRVDDTDEIIRERSERKDEKVEIQSEVHDDGTIEFQVESRSVKAKIKNSEIELDVKNNNIGITDDNGNKIELVHLPDQAMQKFIDLGISASPDSLEVGQSGNNYEYTINATETHKLFGLFPRETKYKLSLNDSNGYVGQQKVANNIVDQILNLFSF